MGELSTDHNPSYGLNTSQHRETDSTEMQEYNITPTPSAPTEAVYEEVN